MSFSASCLPVAVLLADPLIYTLLLAIGYALIVKIGYSRAAELIYGGLQSLFGRTAHRQFIASWKDLKHAKAEVAKTSPQVQSNYERQSISFFSIQDEFAKWAKLQRKVDALQADFDKKCNIQLVV